MTTEEQIQYAMDRLDAIADVFKDVDALKSLVKMGILREMLVGACRYTIRVLQDAKDACNDHIQPDTCILPVESMLTLLNDLAEIETRLDNCETIEAANDLDDMTTLHKRISLHVSGITCQLIDQGHKI